MKTLAGDRGVEWSWAFDHLPSAVGPNQRVLDFGPMEGFFLSADALAKGYSVLAVGVEHITPPSGIDYVRHDLLTTELKIKFDYVLNVSTTEHVGLMRYGDPRNPDGDLEAMRKLRGLMKPDAKQILTVPVGQDAVVGHYHRVYGSKRLPRLLEGYRILEEQYFVKSDDDSQWVSCSKERALAEVPVMSPVANIIELCYALGGYVLCLA